MTSKNISTLLQQHQENTLLAATPPPLTAQLGKDLSTDEWVAPLDEQIIAGTMEALEAGNTHYVNVPGIAPLRQAFADNLGLGHEEGHIVVTAGVQESRFLTIQMIGQGYDSIAMPAVVHPGASKALGPRPMPMHSMAVAPDTLLPTLDAIKSALDAGVKLVYLESPSRLTGATYSVGDVAAIAAMMTEHDAGVIWDQGLAPWSDAASIAAEDGMTARSALIGEGFPGLGLASWYISYIAAPEDWVAPMQKQKQIMAICTATASQYAALEASKLAADKQAAHLSKLGDVRAEVMSLAEAAGATVLPGATACVIALRFPDGKKAAAMSTLNDAGYTVADGAAFGAEDVIRLTLTTDGNPQAALKLLA
jgi:aspartate/methionine/tyrosine aminotransferase